MPAEVNDGRVGSRPQFDLKFRLLGVPVRIHPFFWLVSAIMGFAAFENDIPAVLLWMACVSSRLWCMSSGTP